MTSPDDIHISRNDLIYSDVRLPREAVLFGFTIDDDRNTANQQILNRLAMLDDKDVDWHDIILDGKCDRRSGSVCDNNDKRCESPFAPFVLSFEQLLLLLKNKLNRMLQLEKLQQESSEVVCPLDWFIYRESIITQVAGMCVASNKDNKKNYTIQAFLYRQGEEDCCSAVENILEQSLCVDCNRNSINVRTALKIVRDKFICHFDNLEKYDLHGNIDRFSSNWSRGDMLVLLKLLLPCVSDDACAVIRLIQAINDVYINVIQNRKYGMLRDGLNNCVAGMKKDDNA